MGEPVGLALDSREDGRDGVDAVGGGVVAGDGFAFCDPGSCLIWHASRVAEGAAISKGWMAPFPRAGSQESAGHFVFAFFGFGLHDDSRISHQSQGHIANISGHFALDLESNSRRVPASQGGTIMGRN